MGGFGQANFLQALGWAVLNSLWQMALLWVIFQLVTSLPRFSSRQKCNWATLSLITGFAWFVYTLFSILGNHPADASIVSSGLVNVERNEQLNDWLHTTLPLASLLYLALLVLPLLRFIRNYRYVQVVRQYGLSKLNVEWRMFVKKMAAQMGIKKPVQIWVSELVSSPITIGYLKPLILVPMAAINHLSPAQMEAVLLHELSHIRRYDFLVNLVVHFIQTLLYFNPFVKALVKAVERDRERSCDEMVIQFQYDSHQYASALLILEKHNHSFKPLAVAAAGNKNDLLHRIELILGVHKKPVISFNRLAGLFAGLLCIIALNTVLLMTKPVDGKKSTAFTHLASPFFFFTGDNTNVAETPVRENTSAQIVHHAKTETNVHESPMKPVPVTNDLAEAPTTNPGFIIVNFTQPEIDVRLKNYQETQVKEAVEASKKVLEAAQWRSLEKNIGEVLTEKEKEQLRATYQKQLARIDWKKWENKLRKAYNQVDWESVNEQLARAMTGIRLDSIQKVYDHVACELDQVQHQLTANQLKGIPDSDITLKDVELKRQEVIQSLNHLRSIRTKKIVRL